MGKLKDLTGKSFGRLSVIKETKRRNRGSVVWVCRCVCGHNVFVSSLNLMSGSTKSCGCIRKELLKSGRLRRTHGHRKHPLYWVWSTMKARCLNIKNHKYLRYGARGITISKEWMKFECFYRDMGHSYKSGLQLDRVDNNSGYCKSNCRWTTSLVNNNNRYY